ncbi:RIP metalloprotease RseP, partial [Staphylococcus pseudintermedius]
IIGLAYYEGVPVPKIAQVGEKSPAQQIGLQKGDEIKKIGNHEIHRFNDVKKQLEATEGKPTTIVIERDGKTIEKEFSPKKVEIQTTKTTKQTDYQLGFMPERERSLFEPLLFGIQQTIEYGKIIFVAVASMIASIFTGDFSFDMLNGPVGIYKNVDTVVKTGIINLISWTAVLSVNLGIMNLLPIPALDGGRILFVIYEAIFRKPANKKAETVIIAAGAVFVLIIMVLVTWNDIQRYFL